MKREKPKVLWAAKTEYPKNWGIKSHKHDCYQLFYIKSGNCQYTIQGEDIDVKKNDYILILPNIEHSMQKNHESLVKMVDIKFKLNESELADKLCQIEAVNSTSESVRDFFKLISNEIKNTGIYYKEVIESCTYILLLKLISDSGAEDNPNIMTGIEEKGWSTVCQSVARYIEENYSQQISLNAIADALGYNKNYLCGMFKDETSMTIMDYLRRMRIEKTCELIEMSDYTFSQICFMVGFKSIHHFNKIFKAVMNETPSEYKMTIKERSSAVIQDTFKNVDNYDIT